MGAGFYGSFGSTKGNKKALIEELEKNNIKFNKDEIVFITKDSENQIVWLENGTDFAGLRHIIQRHGEDFKEKHGIEEVDITNHLNSVFSKGKVEYSRPVIKNGRLGYEKLYSYNGNYYLLSGIGSNGYIVSAYPIDPSAALKLKGRYER